MKHYYDKEDDVVEFMQAFPDVDFRHFISPSQDYTTYMMDFRGESTTKTMMMGRQDGTDAIQKGEGYMFKQLQNWKEDKEL